MNGAELPSFGGAGGRTIVYRVWSPAGDQTRAVVVIAHGLGEHSGRYQHVARWLTAAGYAVYAPDHHGHGRSQGRRVRVSLDDAAADLEHVVQVARGQHPALPVFVLGHSMGGAIALRHALRFGSELAGLVLSGPLTAVEPRAAVRALAKIVGRLLPGAQIVKLDARQVSRDPAVVESYAADPLVHHGPIPAGTVAGFIRHQETIFDEARTLTMPTLLMYGTADGLVPPAASARLGECLGADDLTVRRWEGLYHEIFNEPEQDAVLGELIDWLNAHS